MIKIITLLPIFDNNGDKIPTEIFKWFENQILILVGSFSHKPTKGILEGAWTHKDITYRDTSIEYIIAVKTQKQVKEIKKLVIEAGRRTNQLAMYFEVQYDAKVEILEVK